MNKIILASSSPRRKELLEKAGIDFIIDASSIEEVMNDSLPLTQRLINLAYDKGFPIHQKYQQDVVISADTIVYHEGDIIGKAENEDEARKTLLRLSQSTHVVYTSVCVFRGEDVISFVDSTRVTFKDISTDIDDYITSLEWVGKAGAYGIQGAAECFVSSVEGDKDNVIGLPITHLKALLQLEGIIE